MKEKTKSFSYEKSALNSWYQLSLFKYILKKKNPPHLNPLFIIASFSPLKFHHSTINTASKCQHIIVHTCRQGAHMLLILNMDTQSHVMSLPPPKYDKHLDLP